jgi:hypothetical protein
MNNAPGLQSRTEGIFTLNLITVIEGLLGYGFSACPPCLPCQPCQRTGAQMNKNLNARADTSRTAIITEEAFIKYVFVKAFPGELYPLNGKYDPRIIAITRAMKLMKNES